MNLLRLITFRQQAAAGFDPDAQAFITAAGITDPTQQSAINTLVLDLKGYGIWTKMIAVYPLVGGTATSCKYNLKDPRDLDIAYRLTFVGAVQISSTGIKSNTTALGVYANTHFDPNSAGVYFDDAHLSFYSRTNNTNNSYDMAGDTSGGDWGCIIYGTRAYAFFRGKTPNVTIANSLGLQTAVSTSSGVSRYVNSSKVVSTTPTTHTLGPTQKTYLLANSRQINGETSTREFAFASIGYGLSDLEVTNLYTAVQAYQTTLGRQV